MWLLKLHIAFSILCLLTCDGFMIAAKDLITENGWPSKKKRFLKKVVDHWIYFIPFMNIIAVISVFMMLTIKKVKYDEFVKNTKEKEKTDES